MSLNALVKWFKPREMVFFDLLEGAAGNLVDIARLFASETRRGDAGVLHAMRKQIKDLEHRGDHFTHEILDHLDKTFVTPIEREDILALTHAMDDVADCIDAAAERLVLYKIDRMTPIAKDMADLLVRGTETLLPLIQSLRTMSDVKKIRAGIQELTSLENQSDALFHAALADIFETPTDPIALIKWKEIYSVMEDAMDRVELVAKVVGSTVMRNA